MADHGVCSSSAGELGSPASRVISLPFCVYDTSARGRRRRRDVWLRAGAEWRRRRDASEPAVTKKEAGGSVVRGSARDKRRPRARSARGPREARGRRRSTATDKSRASGPRVTPPPTRSLGRRRARLVVAAST